MSSIRQGEEGCDGFAQRQVKSYPYFLINTHQIYRLTPTTHTRTASAECYTAKGSYKFKNVEFYNKRRIILGQVSTAHSSQSHHVKSQCYEFWENYVILKMQHSINIIIIQISGSSFELADLCLLEEFNLSLKQRKYIIASILYRSYPIHAEQVKDGDRRSSWSVKTVNLEITKVFFCVTWHHVIAHDLYQFRRHTSRRRKEICHC